MRRKKGRIGSRDRRERERGEQAHVLRCKASDRSRAAHTHTDPERVVCMLCLPNKKGELKQRDDSSTRAHDAQQSVEVRRREPDPSERQSERNSN